MNWEPYMEGCGDFARWVAHPIRHRFCVSAMAAPDATTNVHGGSNNGDLFHHYTSPLHSIAWVGTPSHCRPFLPPLD